MILVQNRPFLHSNLVRTNDGTKTRLRWTSPYLLLVGVSNGHRNFQLLAKFGLCSICSQNLDECSLARARKIFAIARMLGFSLKFAQFLKIL